MDPGDDRLKDMFDNFAQGTHTEPIERPKVAIFLMKAFNIGFANANLPAWWHRLLPPSAQLRIGEDHGGSADEDDSRLQTSSRGLSNAARQRARLDRDNQSFWNSARPMFEAAMGSVAAPESAASVAVVTPAICVQLLQAVPTNPVVPLSLIEQDVRNKALNWMANVFDEDARMRARPPASDGDGAARGDDNDRPQPPANRRRTH
jgi:hypothetical protein